MQKKEFEQEISGLIPLPDAFSSLDWAAVLNG